MGGGGVEPPRPLPLLRACIDRDQEQVHERQMNVSIKVIEVLFNNHSFIIYLFIYLYIYLLLWHFSGTHVRTCVQVATPLISQISRTITGGKNRELKSKVLPVGNENYF